MKGGPFSFEISTVGAVAVVAVRGEVDLATAPRLGAALNDVDDTGDVALDLSGVDFMDSTGLHAILVKAGTMRAKGGSLRISSASPPVRRLLHVTDLTSLLETVGS